MLELDEGLEALDLEGVDLTDADLAGQPVSGCLLRRCALTGTDLRRARLTETRAGGLRRRRPAGAARSSWRDVVVGSCRLGSLEAYETEWRGSGSRGRRSTT